MYNDASSGIYFAMLIIWFYLKKNLKNKDFVSVTQVFKLLVWVPKIIKTYIKKNVMGNYMPSIGFKMSNCKISHLQFCRFFRQTVTKIMGKTAIWTILCFSPLPPLNNVEEL